MLYKLLRRYKYLEKSFEEELVKVTIRVVRMNICIIYVKTVAVVLLEIPIILHFCSSLTSFVHI